MGKNKKLTLNGLDKQFEKKGFERRNNKWFATTQDLGRVIRELAFGDGYAEIRIIYAGLNLIKEEEERIFNTEISKKFDRYIIYIKPYPK